MKFSSPVKFLKKVPDRDDTHDLATFCGTATSTRGRGETGANKLKIRGWLNNFVTDCKSGKVSRVCAESFH